MSESKHNPTSQKDEALLSWIQKFAPYGIATLDELFQVRSWNHWMELHSGLQFKDVVGKNLFTIFPDLEDRRLVSHFERALEGEASVLSTALHRYLLPMPSLFRENGLTHMLQTARIAPLFSGGKVCGIVAVIEDVTQREIQAKTLARQHRRDELLSWALAQLLKTGQPRKEVRQLFFKIAEQLDFDAFLIYLRNFETGTLSLDAAGGIPVELEKDFVQCPFRECQSPNPHGIRVLDAISSHSEPESALLRKAGVSAAVILPLHAKDRNLGLLCFATGTCDSILPEESDFLMTIAQYLATALDRENTNQQLHKAKEALDEHAQLLEKRVEERTARLKDTISELETFSYTIAHDLRAPVRGMNGFCEVLIEDFGDILPSAARELVGKIASASMRMETLTRDLLEFSKVSQQEVAMSRIEIEPIIKDILAQYPQEIRETTTLHTPLHPVRAHEGLLKHVFSNLIGNAIKFVDPQKAPRITIFTEVLSQSSPNTRSRSLVFSSNHSSTQDTGFMSQQPSLKQVRIWVQDEGIGIPQSVHQKIFGIFERGVTSRAYEGTGIGLAIVARALQRMGGTCGVDSEPGKGSRFWIELPTA